MRILRKLAVLILLAFVFWHFYGDTYKTSGVDGLVADVRSDVNTAADSIHLSKGIEWFNDKIQRLTGYLEEKLSDDDSPEPSPPAKPDLDAPSQQTFSIFNIELGDQRDKVEKETGEPERTSRNEYGSDWVTYHDQYSRFVMVSYDDNDRVNGLFTNQDLLASTNGISFSSTRQAVRSELGDPLDTIQKGMVRYQMEANGAYDLFQINNHYVTLFYDKQNDYKVTAVQMIDTDLEKQKHAYYADANEALRKGFERQLFDLTNASRVKFGRETLSWGDPALPTARSHSTDMADNDYFSHTNLDGQSPFDRMDEDDVDYRTAGENLASGQSSSIFAHQGLMNSPGHRKNILKRDYKQLAVGIAFNDDDHPYYTETFWRQ